MIADWKKDAVFFSQLLPNRHPVLWEQLSEILRTHSIPARLLAGTRDIWARDFCPIQVGPSRFVKFRYCPDYLRAGYEHLITGNRVCGQMGNWGEIQVSRIILDGGNVVAAGNKAILTDKVFSENPKWERGRLLRRLAVLLQVDQCIIIPREPGCPIGHSDGIVRFLDDNLVVVNDYSKIDPGYGKRLRQALAGHGLQIETISHFREDRSEDGIPSAVGNYVNYLRIGRLVVVPAYGRRQDEEVRGKLESLCPESTVVPLNCVRLAREGGVLNCVTSTAWGRG